MVTWLTFLLPVATYVGGVLTKPLQTAVEDWRARNGLRDSLYADLGHNLDVAATRMRICLEFPREAERDGVLDARFVQESFDYALKNPPLFHQLRESKRIRLFYESLNSLQSTQKGNSSYDAIVGGNGFLIRNVADGLKAGDYRRKLVYKHVSRSTREMIDLREKG